MDGLGGAHPLTSKAGIVDRSDREGIDLEFRFAQLQPDSDQVDTTANCGNMLAAVVPFAVESGLLTPHGKALGRTGHESPEALNADEELKARLEALRPACGELMGLDDVSAKNHPKMTLVAPRPTGAPLPPAASSRTCATRRSACSRP